MKRTDKSYLMAALLLLFAHTLLAQAYQFKTYSVDNGISQPYIYTINQDRNAYLWIGTGEGLCKFDGVSFKSFYTTDGIAENFITASYLDDNRNLWFGFNQGNVTVYDGKIFKSINTSGFAKSPVTAITQDDKGNIWCATQNDGIFRISKNFEVSVHKIEFDRENIYSIAFLNNNRLLVGTMSGLKLYMLDGADQKPRFINIVSSIPETQIHCIVHKKNSNGLWIGTQDEGLFLLTPTSAGPLKAVPATNDPAIRMPDIQDVYEDAQGGLWVATFGNGLYKLQLSQKEAIYEEAVHLSDDNGLGNKYIKSIYADHEGNLWVGTYGTGIVHITDNYFSFYKHATSEYGSNVTTLLTGETQQWFGLENGLLKNDPDAKEEWKFYSRSNGFVDDRVTAICRIDTNLLFIGTERSGLYAFDPKKETFKRIELNPDELCNCINGITGYRHTLWIATKNGAFRLDLDKKATTHYTTENGLPHNNINYIYYDRQGKIYIGMHSNFLSSIRISDDKIENQKIYNASDLLTITGIIVDLQHNVWVSTFGNGVFMINKKITRYATETGLLSNYCYGLTDDGSGNIWTGHRGGLSRIRVQKGSIDIFNKNNGISGDCNYNAFAKDEDGNAWFGTTDGAVRFDPHKDKKNVTPPVVNISSIRINDKEIAYNKDIELPYDNYKLRIDFIGISFKANSNILYQYKLEGFDADFSDKTKNAFVQYGKLTDGDYHFILKAYNSDGVSNTVPVVLHIVIDPPYWKRWWFIVLVVAAIFYAIYFYIKIRERNYRRFQAQLQKSLNEKTREVIAQKEEIEKKNKDITDSIRYAKRIQDALLPEVKKLNAFVPQSFIFFQPRDIVSGDFYWYEKYGNELIIACADATGHGVPGAFMSMIGSTLLKDITSRPDITSPAHALEALDDEIRMLLKQHDDEYTHTQDSVDVVICEINLETNFVRICSTKRPVFIVKNNELKLVKKESSGPYDTVDIQLSIGDTLYLFTDGYPDQFGGEKGKKIKMSNMRSMLEQIHSLPFDKQEMIVNRYFNRWKEGYEQVDDVLFMGIRL